MILILPGAGKVSVVMNQVLSCFSLFFKHRSLQTVSLILFYTLFASFFSTQIHQGFYTVSLLIKDVLLWIMPLTVGFFVAYTVSSFKRQAPLFILILILFEITSNMGSVWYAYFSAKVATGLIPTLEASTLDTVFEPLWRLGILRPSWWSAEKGALVGLILGCVSAFGQYPLLQSILTRGKNSVEWLLTQVFSRLIPLFILGFIAHMTQTKLLDHVLGHYALLVGWLVVFLAAYLVFLFALGAGGVLPKMLTHIRNLLPAGGIALTSGCSLSTMPWTIQGAAKNLKNPKLAKAIIPATTNIQQIGDCIANAFLCFLIYVHFYGHAPDLMTWSLFSFVFVLARFATAAVLGGAIFIMLPIYETYLGFTPEMIAIILALNVVLDPLITSCNVMANGALCRVFEKIWSLYSQEEPKFTAAKSKA